MTFVVKIMYKSGKERPLSLRKDNPYSMDVYWGDLPRIKQFSTHKKATIAVKRAIDKAHYYSRNGFNVSVMRMTHELEQEMLASCIANNY